MINFKIIAAYNMNVKKVLITGITGQDGSYLAELLLSLDYKVAGVVRDKTKLNNIKEISKDIELFESDVSDFDKLKSIILGFNPNHIYNLGGVTTLSAFDQNPSYSIKVTEGSVRTIFDAGVDLHNKGNDIRIFQASTCLLFGLPSISPQNELTPYNPKSLYAKTKLNVDIYAKHLREIKNLYISCGILYNHESPRRSLNFVTRKITAAAACIYNKVKKIPHDGFEKPILTQDFMLKLSNIKSKRDWGDARDFVRAFLLMLEQDQAEDFVLATGQVHSVQDILETAFGVLSLDWRHYVIEDTTSIRTEDPVSLCGDASKAKSKLGWQPQYKFEDTIKDMVENDLKIFSS